MSIHERQTISDNPLISAKSSDVPSVLLILGPVDSADSIVDAIDTEFVGAYPDDWTESLVSCISCMILTCHPLGPKNPCSRERCYVVSIGNFRQWCEVGSLELPG